MTVANLSLLSASENQIEISKAQIANSDALLKRLRSARIGFLPQDESVERPDSDLDNISDKES